MFSVFVYGTLKRGYYNHYLMQDEKNGEAKFVCDGFTVEKYPLVIATKYFIPFLLNQPGVGKIVHGEIWEVDEKMLATLDKLEMHPSWYTRTEVEVTMQDEGKTKIKCLTYLLHDFDPKLLENEHLDDYKNKVFKYVGRLERDDIDITIVKKK